MKQTSRPHASWHGIFAIARQYSPIIWEKLGLICLKDADMPKCSRLSDNGLSRTSVNRQRQTAKQFEGTNNLSCVV
ncbi:MAG: hypothetical protein J7641_19410 [Cyanobacteria bacterium SID2]|nr:hypothetical protein [Cyanobacteria bacterium SID2]